jgi:DNA-binding MarR family transcriptional regulator
VPLAAPSLAACIVAARQSLRQAISGRARRFRLTSQQFWAVVALKLSPGKTPKDLAESLLLDAPAASRLLASLVSRTYVELRPDRSDRRRVRIHLTDAGDRLGDSLLAIHEEFQAAVVRGMSDEECAALCAGLRRVVENLAEFEGADAVAPAPTRARAG